MSYSVFFNSFMYYTFYKLNFTIHRGLIDSMLKQYIAFKTITSLFALLNMYYEILSNFAPINSTLITVKSTQKLGLKLKREIFINENVTFCKFSIGLNGESPVKLKLVFLVQFHPDSHKKSF